MTPALYLRSIVRESRGLGGRLAFFVACLSVGVAAVVAVAGLSSSLNATIRVEARALLAADVSIDGWRSIPREVATLLGDSPGYLRTDVRTMTTIVAAPEGAGRPGRSQLVQLKVIDGTYPFYGVLGLDPVRPLSDLLDDTTAVVAPEVLTRLGIAVGDTLRIGGEDFRIAGKVVSEPDRLDMGFSIGPRVFVSGAGLARTVLESRGSRVAHRTLIKLPDGADGAQARAAADRIRAVLPADGSYEVETYLDAQPALRRGLTRAEPFLGLVALLSLLVGGIGVAQTVRSWLASRTDSIAMLRCLGMRPREVTALYVGQTLLLGLAGSLAGAILGSALLLATPRLLPGLVSASMVTVWQPAACARGIGLGLGVALLFAVPELLAIRRVSPLRVLRRDVEPVPPSRGARLFAVCVLCGGVFAMAVVQSGTVRRAAGFTAGLAVVVSSLVLAAWVLARWVGRAPRAAARVWGRHGLAAIARPGADTLGSIVALGMGTLVVLGMFLVERQLSRSLAADLPKDAPSAFFVDVQTDQWPGLRELLVRHGATEVVSVPIVRARLSAVDGRTVEQLAAAASDDEARARRWALTREQNLTYLTDLPSNNRIVEGAWWTDASRAEASIEVEFAHDLGARIGSSIEFDVQGITVPLVVTSLRHVEWRSFQPNFFVVVEPGVLEDAPQLRVAAARLPPGSDQQVQDEVVAAFPNIVPVRIREILEKVAAVLAKVALGVRVLGGFTMLAGVMILAGAVGAVSVRRGREVALLKTLGMTRLGVLAVFAVEHALVGVVAGMLGAAGGGVLAWAVITRGMDLTWETTPLPFVLAVAGCALLAVSAGTAASGRALARRPAEVLRSE